MLRKRRPVSSSISRSAHATIVSPEGSREINNANAEDL